MKKISMAVLLMVMILLSVVQPASAYTGGLLHGKSMNWGSSQDVATSTTTVVTDGDETQSHQLGAIGSSSDTLWRTLDTVETISGYYLKRDTNSTFQIYFYDAEGVQVGQIEGRNTATGIQAITPITNVKKVAIMDSINPVEIYEFDVFAGVESPVAPDAPTGLSGVAGNAKVNLTWNHVEGRTYNVYMNGTKQNGTPLTTADYEKTGLVNGTAYNFQVTAISDSLESVKSETVSITPIEPADTTPPNAPTELVGSGGDAEVSLMWSASDSMDTSGYNVYIGSMKQNTSPVTGTSFTVTGLTNGQVYDFTVRAVDASGNESSNSNLVSVAPTNEFVVTLVANGTSIIVNASGGEKPYSVTIDGRTEVMEESPYYFVGLARETDYVVLVEDSLTGTYTTTVNTGSTTSYVPPAMPDSQTLFQNMVNSFGMAATIGLSVIGGAVALGVLIILALWAWRLLKKWLASSK